MSFPRVRSALIVGALLLPSLALAVDTPPPSSGGGFGQAGAYVKTAGGIAYGASAGAMPLEAIVGNLVQTFLGLLGVIFLVLTVYGGYRWMMARGNEQEVAKAIETIKAAVIGLGIVLGAYAITTFVVNNLIAVTTGQAVQP